MPFKRQRDKSEIDKSWMLKSKDKGVPSTVEIKQSEGWKRRYKRKTERAE